MSDTPERFVQIETSLPASRVSGLAVLAFCLCLVPITFPLGAILVGLTVLHTRRRPDLSGLGLAKIGLTVGLGLMLSATLFVVGCNGFGFTNNSEQANRIRCRANLSGMAKAIQMYANQNSGAYPNVGPGYDPMYANQNSGAVIYPNVGPGYDPKTGRNRGTGLDTMASMWLLVTVGGQSASAFVCPSDTEAVAFRRMADPGAPFPECDGNGVTQVGGGHRCWSYGYQIPNAATGGPGGVSQSSTKFAIMADRPPPLTGKASERMILLTGLGGEAPTDSVTAGRSLRQAKVDDRKRINSPNHGGDGQNVLYQDGHADWSSTPCCGINDDDIYTVATGVVKAGDTDLPRRVIGTIPTASSIPLDQDDSVIVNISWGTLTEVYTK